ncbi:MAG: glycosyltransferase [Gemmatimonas sp.]
MILTLLSPGVVAFVKAARGHRTSHESNPMARLLHVIHGLAGGGAERQLTLLAAVQATRGHDVHVATVLPEIPAALANAAVTVHVMPASGNHDPLHFWRLRLLISRVRATIVQSWLTQSDVMGGLAALSTRTPWVLSERSSAAGYPAHWKHSLRARLARRAAAIVANSTGGVQYWRSQGVTPNRIYVVPNVVETATIRDAVVSPLPLAFEGRPVVLYAGRLSDEKNLFVMIDALALAFATNNAVALLCGTGPLHSVLAARIEELGLRDRIVLAGHRPDVFGLLKRAALCLAVSRYEGSPNSVLEAMAAGCPLVVSDIPAYTELLDAQTAVIVERDNIRDTAQGILRVLNDAVSAAARAEQARLRIAGFTAHNVAAMLDAVYDQL